MDSKKSLAALALVFAVCVPAYAATITGTYSYDGVAVAAVYSDITGGRVLAYGSGAGNVWGTIDTAAGTFRIEDVPPGSVTVQLELDRSQPSDDDGSDAGDLIGVAVTSIASALDTVSVSVSMRSVVHFTNPFDSNAPVSASFNTCPSGAAVDSPVTVRWEAVPRATTYDVAVRRQACGNTNIESTTIQQSTTEIAVTLGTATGEDHVDVWLECTGGAGTNLCSIPFISYQDNSAQSFAIHESGGDAGRGTDHADGFFIPAVARTSGVGTAYWSSAVTVVNTDTSSQQIDVIFTPQDGDGWTNYQTTNVTIAAGAAAGWTDVLQELFSTTGAGSLEIRGDKLAVSSRTSTPAVGGGTYGVGIPPLATDDLLSLSGNKTAYAGGVKEEPGVWRTNLGLCEVSGKTVQVRVTVYDENGVALGNQVVTLGPYKNIQINRVARALTSSNRLDNGIIGIEVTGAAGKVGAYLTIIDGATDDSSYTVIAPQSPTGG